MNEAINSFALQSGMDDATLLAVLAIASLLCRLVGKLIPDDKPGILGLIRRIAKTIGLYTSNRVTSGVTQASIAREIVSSNSMLRK